MLCHVKGSSKITPIACLKRVSFPPSTVAETLKHSMQRVDRHRLLRLDSQSALGAQKTNTRLGMQGAPFSNFYGTNNIVQILGTPFSSFTGTKVHILTQKPHLDATRRIASNYCAYATRGEDLLNGGGHSVLRRATGSSSQRRAYVSIRQHPLADARGLSSSQRTHAGKPILLSLLQQT